MDRDRRPPQCLSAVQAFLRQAATAPIPQRLDTSGAGPTIRLDLSLGLYDVGNEAAVPDCLKGSSGILLPEILEGGGARKKRRRVREVRSKELEEKLEILREINKRFRSTYVRPHNTD